MRRASGNFFYQKSTIGTTIAATEANNNTIVSKNQKKSSRWGNQGKYTFTVQEDKLNLINPSNDEGGEVHVQSK